MSNTQVHATLARIEVAIARLEHRLALKEDEVWAVNEIAAFLKVSAMTVRRLAARHPDFPLPLPLETGEAVAGRVRVRYWSADVRRWARNQQREAA